VADVLQIRVLQGWFSGFYRAYLKNAFFGLRRHGLPVFADGWALQ